MRILIIFLLFYLTISCQSESKPKLVEEWSTQPVLKTPESILYIPEYDMLYVANINGSPLNVDGNGFISKLTTGGEIVHLEWVSGLNAPKGMGYIGNKLFVTDINMLVEIDLDSAKVVNRYPAEHAVFLNDIAIDHQSNVYVTDYSGENSAIYRLNEKGLKKWLVHPEISRPNGLLIKGDELLFGNTGDGKIKAVDLENQIIRLVVDAKTGADGLRTFGDQAFIISDWAGRTAMINVDGEIIELLNTTEQNINSADLEYIAEKNMVIIPTFFDNRVMAYRLIP